MLISKNGVHQVLVKMKKLLHQYKLCQPDYIFLESYMYLLLEYELQR